MAIEQLDYSKLEIDEDDVPFIELGDARYRLPYHDLIPQTVDVESLAESIKDEGLQVSIQVNQIDDDVFNVIDGNTRLYVANELGLSAADIPFETVSEDDEKLEDEWKVALTLNAQRRQINGTIRRELIEKIDERENWRKKQDHVSELARYLGVAKSTISKDLAKMEDPDDLQRLKKWKSKVQVALTGMRNLNSFLEEGEIESSLSEEDIDEYQETLDELIETFGEEKEALKEQIEAESGGS